MIPESPDRCRARRRPGVEPARGVIARYRDWLPVADTDPVITLGEGSTPLVEAEVLSDRLGCEVWLKVEGAQPDRVVQGPRDDRRGQRCPPGPARRRWSAPRPATPRPRPRRTRRRPVCCRSCCCRPAGSPPASSPRRSCTAPRWCRSTATSTTASSWPASWPTTTRWRWSTRSTRSGIEGQKTAAFEVVDDLGDAPDLHVLPVGNAGNISAYWRGYTQYAAAGKADADTADVGFPGRGCRAAGPRPPGARSRDGRHARSGSATPPRRSWRWRPGTSRTG